MPSTIYQPVPIDQPIGEYSIRFQTAPWLEEKLSEQGICCSACISLTRDLGVFSRSSEQYPKGPKNFVQWIIRLDALVEAATAGCQFCSFMADRFFDDRIYSFIWGTTPNHTKVACCFAGSAVPPSERVTRAIKSIQESLKKYPDAEFTLLVQPTDYEDEGMGFGRLRIRAVSCRPEGEENMARDILGLRKQIILEVYAQKGKLRSH
jgi:hypothetical protein